MALANAATIYAQRGKRVLALDFDFEAPGLHRYFLAREGVPFARHEPALPQSGVLNLFYALQARLQESWPDGQGFQEPDAKRRLPALITELWGSSEYCYRIRLENPNVREAPPVEIDFVPAARFDDTYADLVRSFDWQSFYENYAEALSALMEELARKYDYVLIDSRTGVTDIGSICTMMLPDKLVLVLTPNEQSLRGALDAGWQAIQGRKHMPNPRPLPVFPLLSRVEEGEEKLRRTWIERVRHGFEHMFREAYGPEQGDLEVYFNMVRIPHRGFYAYGECIAAEEQNASESGSLAQAYQQFVDCLDFADAMEAQQGLRLNGEAERVDIESNLISDFINDDGVLRQVAHSNPIALLLKLREASELNHKGQPEKAMAEHDAIIEQVKNATDVTLRVILSAALGSKGYVLGEQRRHLESVATYRELLRLFGNATESTQRISAGRALVNMAAQLACLGRHNEAINACEEAIRRFRGRFEKKYVTVAREGIARAFVHKGNSLAELGRYEDELSIYDELLADFGAVTDPLIVRQVATVLVNKGAVLARLKRTAESFVVREEVILRFGESTDLKLRGQIAVALIAKADLFLNDLERYEDAVAACDDLLRRLNGASEPDLIVYIAEAMKLKGAALGRLNRPDDALAVYGELISRFGGAVAAELRESVVQALYLKAELLCGVGRRNEALVAYDELIRKFKVAEIAPSLQKYIGNGFVEKISLLKDLGRTEDVLLTYDELAECFEGVEDTGILLSVWQGLLNKGHFLIDVARYDEAIAAYEQFLNKGIVVQDLETKDLTRAALNGIGIALLCKAKQIWRNDDEVNARVLLHSASDKLAAACGYGFDDWSVPGNAGYVAFLLGREEEARELLFKAFALGGEDLRAAELADADIYSLPQDEEFRSLVRSL